MFIVVAFVPFIFLHNNCSVQFGQSSPHFNSYVPNIPIVKFPPKSWMLFVSGKAEADFDWTGKVGVSN